MFVLPDHIKVRVDEQYRRDVAAVHGEEVAVKMESEYSSFLKELGGERPGEGGGAGAGSFSSSGGPKLGLGYGGRGGRRDDDDNDPRCLYVGYLPNTMVEEELGKLLASTCEESPEDVRIIKDKYVWGGGEGRELAANLTWEQVGEGDGRGRYGGKVGV